MRRRTSPSPAAPYRVHQAHNQVNAANSPAGRQVSSSLLIRSFNVESNPTRPLRPSPLTASAIPDMPLDLVDRIRSFPLFMSAPEDFLAAIGKHLRPQVHAAHDHILTEGDEARAMYWLVRGVVAVTSRDGEAVYAELKPGAFFGEIGVLMDMPRTATIIARSKCLLVVLKKEDLHAELPKYPDMEKAIRQEAQERLNILKKKQQERGTGHVKVAEHSSLGTVAKSREAAPGEVSTGEMGIIAEGTVFNHKKRKSPSPGVIEDPVVGGSALGSGYVNVRKTLTELPLFSTLPPDILHFLGLSAVPMTFSPFTDIIQQGSPGNDIFFIVRGEAEVIHEPSPSSSPNSAKKHARSPSYAQPRPRLHQGQYFGEVASLGLSPGRTATVRSITTVECLMITGQALEELFRRCPPELKLQVEETAKNRYQRKSDQDVDMLDSESPDSEPRPEAVADGSGKVAPGRLPSTPTKQMPPQVTFTTPSKPASPAKDESETRQPTDPDPYLSVDMENMRNRRRNSLAPPTPQSETSSPPPSHIYTPHTPSHPLPNGVRSHVTESSPLRLFALPTPPPPDADDEHGPFKKARTLLQMPQSPTSEDEGGENCVHKQALPDDVLVSIFEHLNLLDLLRLRAVSNHWRKLLTHSPRLCTHVDLGSLNRKVTDRLIIDVLAPFIGARPVLIDITNCFHITDDGFHALWQQCGRNVRTWRMKSVWDVSANQILDMSENSSELEEIDWSNCRKVGDNLLARVVGWVVPEPPPPLHNNQNTGGGVGGGRSLVISGSGSGSRTRSSKQPSQQQQMAAHQAQGQSDAPANPNMPPPGTVVGCPRLRRLDLSYCKHITDRSMAHLAAHASSRLESLTLTRCTSITDAGFQAWAPYRFNALTRLSLADCTYLSDNAVVALVAAAKNLTHLDLSFCCALSDTATEVVALGLPQLRELRLAFCGSAVSDASMGCVALHLNELQGLSVRGCVRVTGVGVENVLEGCGRLQWLDVSQCKNLIGWLVNGGIERWGFDERGTVAPGRYGYPGPGGGGLLGGSAPVMSGSTGNGGGGNGAPFNGGGAWPQPRPQRPGLGGIVPSPGFAPVMRPIVLPKGVTRARTRRPVRFIVEKGRFGLR